MPGAHADMTRAGRSPSKLLDPLSNDEGFLDRRAVLDADPPPNMTLPPQNERIREGVLAKRVVLDTEPRWMERSVVLSRDRLSVSRANSDHVMICIPLDEIVEVHTPGRNSDGQMSPISRTQSQRPELLKQSTLKSNFKNSFKSGLSSPLAPSPHNALSPSQRGEPADPTEQKHLWLQIEIRTADGGWNGGKWFVFECQTEEEHSFWVSDLNDAVAAAKTNAHERRKEEEPGRLKRVQNFLLRIHHSRQFEIVSSILVLISFVNAIYLAEAQPGEDTRTRMALETLDLVIIIAYVVELGITLGALWFWPFFTGSEWGWNWLDLFVVSVSVAKFFVADTAGYNVFRLFRVFRLVRILHRLKKLNKLINAMSSSILPVCNTLAVLLIITAVYALVGVDLWGAQDPEGFGNFSAAFLTMLQIATRSIWSSTTERPLFQFDNPPWDIVLFFITYLFLASVFMLNIVITVLLDEFMGAVKKEQLQQAKKDQKAILEATLHRGTAIDPLLLELSNVSSVDDLNEEIRRLFKMFDVDRNNGLSFEELVEGFGRLNVSPRIRFDEEDFRVFSDGRRFTDKDGVSRVGMEAFDSLIKTQLQHFMKRAIGARIPASHSDTGTETVLYMLKFLMFNEERRHMDPPSPERRYLDLPPSPLGLLSSLLTSLLERCPLLTEGRLVLVVLAALEPGSNGPRDVAWGVAAEEEERASAGSNSNGEDAAQRGSDRKVEGQLRAVWAHASRLDGKVERVEQEMREMGARLGR